MRILLIHYDIQKSDTEYPQLIPILTGLGARRLTPGAWALKTDRSLADVRDEIQICMVPGDRFVIAEITDWRTIGTLSKIDEL